MNNTWKQYFGKGNLDWKALLLHLAIPLLVGGLSGFLTRDAMKAFASLEKPALSPPGWVFPVVWTILFLLMGLGSYIVWKSASAVRAVALGIYSVQLFVNFFWSILFFNFGKHLAAFIWLLFLLALLLVMFYYFRKAEPLAAYLQIPYILWVLFAGYLNFGVYLLNR